MGEQRGSLHYTWVQADTRDPRGKNIPEGQMPKGRACLACSRKSVVGTGFFGQIQKSSFLVSELPRRCFHDIHQISEGKRGQ